MKFIFFGFVGTNGKVMYILACSQHIEPFEDSPFRLENYVLLIFKDYNIKNKLEKDCWRFERFCL